MNLRKILLSVIFAFAAVAALAQTPPGPSQSTSPDRETFTVNGVSFTMIKVPGGTFMMGSDSPEAFDEEKPVHSESVSTFYIGQTEVTQALWTAVMGSNPSYFKGDNRPVEWVSWDDCQTFLRKLNQLTGRNFRLPTEAEWEYAARGGTLSHGYKYSGSNDINSVGWYEGNSVRATHPVGQKTPNELGLYDMRGNVWEWTSYKGSDNYNSPRNSSNRVFRGGGYYNTPTECRMSARSGRTPGGTNSGIGLRLVL